MIRKQKIIWSILVMLAVMTGVTGGLVLLLRWLKGMWIAWETALSCFSILSLVGLLLIIWIYWTEQRYE